MGGPPIIDVSGLGGAGHGSVDEQIDRASTDVGFFVATGHGIEHDVHELLGACEALFALDQEAKERMAMVDRRGYVPSFRRRLDGDLHAAPMEYFDLGLDGPNPSPPIDGFDDLVRGYGRRALGVAHLVLASLARTLDLPDGFFRARMRSPECYLRLMRYEPDQPGAVLTDPHTDYGAITLLATDGVDGLEVRPRGGDWVAVEAPPGSLVVNLGDMLARWTNDRYVSTPHRVVAPRDRPRVSAPFFVNPDAEAIIESLPSCIGPQRSARYPPVTAGEFLARRIAEGGYMSDDGSS